MGLALDKRRLNGKKEKRLGKINLEVAYGGIIPSDPQVLEKEKARPPSGNEERLWRRELAGRERAGVSSSWGESSGRGAL